MSADQLLERAERSNVSSRTKRVFNCVPTSTLDEDHVFDGDHVCSFEQFMSADCADVLTASPSALMPPSHK